MSALVAWLLRVVCEALLFVAAPSLERIVLAVALQKTAPSDRQQFDAQCL